MIDPAYLEQISDKVAGLETEISELSAAGHSPKLRGVLAEHARLKKLLEQGQHFLQLKQELADAEVMAADEASDEDMRAMAREEAESLQAELAVEEKKMQVALLPPDPADNRNIIMEIRAGTGGDEAALFAGDLFRMYNRLSEDRGWKISLLDSNPSNVGGFKEIVFSIEGDAIYRVLRYESGVHRVQRIPATEASGRIHTSAATVAVLPEADDLDAIDIKTEDLRIDVYRASGAGGQHVNTTDSAVRITHLPSGVVVQCQEERSQHRNRDKAMRMLKTKLLDEQRSAEASRAADARRSQIGSGDRSERIRTYNFPQNRLTDHRINLTLYSLDRVMEGGLDELLNTLYDRDIEERLAEQMKQQAG